VSSALSVTLSSALRVASLTASVCQTLEGILVFLAEAAHMGTFCATQNVYFIIIRPHRSTTHVDAAYCYDRGAWSVGLSVRLSICHTSEPCKNGCTDRDAVWVENSGGPN